MTVQNPNEDPGKPSTSKKSGDEPYDVTDPSNRQANMRQSTNAKTNGFVATSEWVCIPLIFL